MPDNVSMFYVVRRYGAAFWSDDESPGGGIIFSYLLVTRRLKITRCRLF